MAYLGWTLNKGLSAGIQVELLPERLKETVVVSMETSSQTDAEFEINQKIRLQIDASQTETVEFTPS